MFFTPYGRMYQFVLTVNSNRFATVSVWAVVWRAVMRVAELHWINSPRVGQAGSIIYASLTVPLLCASTKLTV
jgi:hypothetical protein